MFEIPLTPQNILRAYTAGFFPMPHPEDGTIQWLRPNPRAVLPLDQFHASKSLRRQIIKESWKFSANRSFETVMRLCGETRDKTWIDDRFLEAYAQLSRLGYCRSIEVWDGDALIGGIYGVSIAGAFFAESMFRLRTNASKAALWGLVYLLDKFSISLLEVQFLTPHLQRMGAVHISDITYQYLLVEALSSPAIFPGQEMEITGREIALR